MTYVDLNPVRANIASGISKSRHTSIKARNLELLRDQSKANAPLMPLIGVKSFNVPTLTQAEYIDLVDFTGREWHAGKRGKIESTEPKAQPDANATPTCSNFVHDPSASTAPRPTHAGVDKYTRKKNFEHRKLWVEARILASNWSGQ